MLKNSNRGTNRYRVEVVLVVASVAGSMRTVRVEVAVRLSLSVAT